MATITFNGSNWQFPLQSQQPTPPNYTPEEIQRHKDMAINDVFDDSFRLFGTHSGDAMCRFCGCNTFSMVTGGFDCGYLGTGIHLGNKRAIVFLCKNFHTGAVGTPIGKSVTWSKTQHVETRPSVISSHPCRCHILQLMKTGCICGGV
jgi:hypothetical protein